MTDTVDATPVQALTVRVADASGKPLPGVVVRFEASQTSTGRAGTPMRPTMLVAPLDASEWSLLAVDSTNAEGLAGARVRMGEVAGTGRIDIAAPLLGLSTAAEFTVLPGAATRIRIAPADTGVFVGGTLSFSAGTEDRYGNARTDAIALSLSRNLGTLDGTTLTATTVGRMRVTATSGARSDTAGVSVMPPGTLAAYVMPATSAERIALYVLDLDGGNLRKLATSIIGPGYFGEMPPVWSMDGKSVIYHDNKTDHTRSLWIADAATSSTRRLPTPANELPHEAWPAVSRDGQWVYFNGAGFASASVYRLRADGTGLELLTTTPQLFRPSVSPDGTRVVGINSGGTYVVDLATKQATRVGAAAFAASWSPVDDQLAYVASPEWNTGAIHAVRLDGSAPRAITASVGWYGRVGWSPDAKYLLATKGDGRLMVIVVDTGEEIPVPTGSVGGRFHAPAWRP